MTFIGIVLLILILWWFVYDALESNRDKEEYEKITDQNIVTYSDTVGHGNSSDFEEWKKARKPIGWNSEHETIKQERRTREQRHEGWSHHGRPRK